MSGPRVRTAGPGVFAAITVIALVSAATATQAFTAGGAIPDSRSGAGAGAITGHQVADVSYRLNDVDPRMIDQVSFLLDPPLDAGDSVEARVSGAGGAWYSCGVGGEVVTCDTTSPPAAVASAWQLSVVVVNGA